ncbi:MAG: type II toxin-antitoxin system VapC family toxin [Bacteroidetes bacterium]|nr:type II toxin-antitoxin system VapC family toxin [Bacteroidota bacterium]MCL5027010.1 type II toxin-antitoxin system VapC family toxin [Chloroflexota bacterium]
MIKPHLVVDASVVLKWFRAEEDLASEAQRLLDRHTADEVTLCAPDLLLYEVGSVLRTKPDLDETQLVSAVDYLQHTEIVVFPITWKLLEQAVRIAFRYAGSHRRLPTVYDACYVALAEALDCEMLTADRRLVSLLDEHPLVELLS